MELDLLGELERKLETAEKLKARLSPEEIREAEKDSHAKRLPRPCGLTIHTGIGCSLSCLYCYVRDMGFPSESTPYPLSGLQLAYSLAINPAIALGRGGSLLAFGAVTEPFMAETAGKTIEYLRVVSRELGNPIQLSTKAYLSSGIAHEIKNSCDELSALVTIVTLTFHRVLEPLAPSPDQRYKTMRNLSAAGIHTSLFLRPILPGLNMREFEEIMRESMERGASGVVLGSLRVTEGIIERLRAARYPHLSEIIGRIRGELGGSKQVTIYSSDLKKQIADRAEKIGLKVYPSACAANIEAHGLGCAACKMGPCGDEEKIPHFELTDLDKIAVKFGVRIRSSKRDGFKILIKSEGAARAKRRFADFVKALTKHEILLR